MEKSGRLAYWDNWKGLSIIAVVMIHVSNSIFDFSATSFNYMFGLGLRQIINFAVPMFLSIAGYFSANAINEAPIQYYRKRVWRIVFPYLIWTTIFLILTTPFVLPDSEEILKGYLLGTGVVIGYFVIVLLQFVVITPFLLNISNIRTHLLIIVSLTLVGLAVTYYFNVQDTSSFFSTFPGNSILFVVWYPFYHLGFVVSRYKAFLKIEKIELSVIYILIFVALIFAFLEGIFWTKNGYYKFGVSQIKLSSFVVSFLIFLLTVNLSKKQSWLSTRSVLTWLGGNSFAIYLTHLLSIRVIIKFSILKYIYNIQPLYILVVTTLSLAICTLFIYFTRRLLSSRAAQVFLG